MDVQSKVTSNNLSPWLQPGTGELLGQSRTLQDAVRQKGGHSA